MKTRQPDPSHLRESAAALIQLADDMEDGRLPALPLPRDHEYLLPQTLLQHIAQEMVEECRQRRILMELGAFSDEALAILLATFATGEDERICVEDLGLITGLPDTTVSRLLMLLSQNGAINLHHSTGNPDKPAISLCEGMQVKLARFLRDRVSARLAPSR